MLLVTVRTLDSRSQAFEIDDEVAQDLSVIGFKEFIEMDVGIRADKQRLIFKGKVLQDHKTLMSYGVFGNVIHLVQRSLPSELRQSSLTTTGAESSRTNTQTTSANSNGASNIYIGGILGSGDVGQITQQLVENLLSSYGAGTQANVMTSASNSGSTIDVQIAVQSTSTPSNSQSEAQQRLGLANCFIADAAKILRDREIENSPDAESDTSHEGEAQTELSNTPESLAGILDRLLAFNRDFEPLIVRYQQLLRGNCQDQVPNDDHLPDEIAEVFHSLSHSLHALSDLSVNLQTPEPRSLICFPRLSPIDMPINQPPFGPARPTSTFTPRTAPGAPPSASTAGSQGANSTQQPSTTAATPASGTSFTCFSASTPVSAPGGVSASSSSRGPNIWNQGTLHTVVGITPNLLSGGIPSPLGNFGQSTSQESSSTGQSASLPFSTIYSSISTAASSSATVTSNATPGQNVFTAPTGIPFPNFNSGRPRGVIVPVLQSIRVATASMPRFQSTPVRPAAASTTRDPSTSTSTNSTNTTPSFPFPSLPIPGLNPSCHHPDPLLPCQSFHFGPSFGQFRQQTPPPGAASGTGTRARPGVATASQPQSTATSVHLSGASQRAFINLGPQGQRSTPSGDSFGDSLVELMGSFLLRGMDQSTRGLFNVLIGGDENEADGILHDFQDMIIESMSVLDLVQVFAGTSVEPLNRLYSQLVTLVEKHFNDEQMLTQANIEEVLDRIMREIKPLFVEFSRTIKPKEEDIDLKASILNIMKKWIREGLYALLAGQPGFGERVVDIHRRYCCIFSTFAELYVEGGFEDFCQKIVNFGMSRSQNENDIFYSRFRITMSEYIIPRIRVLAQERPVDRSELDQNIVRVTETTGESTADESTTGESSSSDLSDASTVEPMNIDQPSVIVKNRKGEKRPLEPIDVDKIWAEKNGNNPDEHTKDLETGSSGRPEEWNQHVPRDWIPVINRDIKRQRVGCQRHSPSDAYLSGLPSKRRKALKPCSEEDVDVLGLLQESVAQARVNPETSVSEIVKDSKSCNLQQSFRQQLRHDLQQRLNQDPDYDGKQFPNAAKHFHKDNDKQS